MTRAKSNPTLRLLSFTWIVMMSGTGINTDNPFIDYLKEKLSQYNRDYYVEKTYLVTDRHVYRPGEPLWFKGIVNSSGKHPEQSHSEDYFIKLLNSNGEELIYRRYPLINNEISGALQIPRSFIPGRYWLVAYTGWMKNRCSREAFRKEILISKYFEKRFMVEATFDKDMYSPLDSMHAGIKIIDPTGKPITGTVFNYTLGSYTKNELKGSGITDNKGMAAISCMIPEAKDLQMLTVEIRNRKLSGDFSVIIPSITGDPEINFYPEGGSLISGLKSTIAYSAVSNSLLPAIITGEITDRNGNVLQLIQADSFGKGSFEFIPGMDTTYLRITRPAGITRKYPLPIANRQGIVIHQVENHSDSATVSVTSSDSHSLTTTYWIAIMNKEIVWSNTVNFTQSALVKIPVNDNGPGILQLSVFDNKHQLVAERLINIKRNAEHLVVKTDHQLYHSRQRVNVLLACPETLQGIGLTLSVTQQNLTYDSQSSASITSVNANQCEISSTRLQNHDLTSELDLLTSDYRDVFWQEVLSETEQKIPYVHKDGLTGKVFDRKENASQHAKVRVTHTPNYRSFETQSDEYGAFQVLFGSAIIDYKYLNIDAYDASGKINLTAIIEQSYAEELRNSLIKESKSNEQQKTMDVLSYGEPDLVYVLRYGPGKFRKSIRETRKKYDPNQYAGYAHVLDIIQDIKPYRLNNNKLIFTTDNENNLITKDMEGAIIVINGALKGDDADILKNLFPSDITNINISTSLLDVHKYTPLNFSGVIEITTIQGMYRYRQAPIFSGQNILFAEREFYSPDYSVESTTSTDNRKTLYWNPKIRLDPGKSMLVTFYTSDLKGIFVGHIVGIDDAGNPVERTFSFAVE